MSGARTPIEWNKLYAGMLVVVKTDKREYFGRVIEVIPSAKAERRGDRMVLGRALGSPITIERKQVSGLWRRDRPADVDRQRVGTVLSE